MQPASYSIPDDIRATLVRLLAYMGGLAILAVAAASFFAAPADIVAALGSASAQRPAWSTIERPYPAFELLLPELIGGTYNYAIQRRAKDGARKDMLNWGEPAEAGPYVMVEIYRPAAASDRFLDASSEIATRIVSLYFDCPVVARVGLTLTQEALPNSCLLTVGPSLADHG